MNAEVRKYWREVQRKKRAHARKIGRCIICTARPVTRGPNPRGEDYSTCNECRWKRERRRPGESCQKRKQD